MQSRRVVVTGLGLICGVGNTAPEVWAGLMAGKSGMAEITAYDLTGHSVRFAAEVKGFDPHNFVEKKEARKMGSFINFGIAAFDIIEREHAALLAGGPRKISPFFIPASIINLAAGHVSIKYGAKGPNEATATACT